jgi:hypothetical protein
MALLTDPERIRFACDPHENPRWSHAAVTTVGPDGILPAETFREGRESVARLAAELETAICRGPKAFEPPPLKVVEIPKKEPWELDETPLSEPSGVNEECPTRQIVVRSVRGSCLSNHLAEVLTVTSNHNLPKSAVAYRPGRRDVVRETIVEAASGINAGGYFFAKLDLKDAFNSLNRVKVAEALAAMAYPEEFIAWVMASTGAKRLRSVKGRWIQQPSQKGCPAGLPESAILLNILFREFDRRIEQDFQQVTYLRYSDDLLFLGKDEKSVGRAVNQLLIWCRAQGLQLKGVSPNQKALSLVQDVRGLRLTYLGAEIDEFGEIHLPEASQDAQKSRIRYRLDIAHRTETLVAGVSRYASPPGKGVEAFDRADVVRSIRQFYGYWRPLNEGEAEGFLATVNACFGIKAEVDGGQYEKVWAAALGRPVGRPGGGPSGPGKTSTQEIQRWIEQTVVPFIEATIVEADPSRDGTYIEDLDTEWDEVIQRLDSSGTNDGDEQENPSGNSFVTGSPPSEVAAVSCTQGDASLGRVRGDSPTQERCERRSGSTVAGEDFLFSTEADGSHAKACGFHRAPRGPAGDGCEASGATPQGTAPPGPPEVEELRLIFLSAIHNVEGALVGSYEVSRGGPSPKRFVGSLAFPDERVETAVVRYLSQRLAAAGGAICVVLMDDAWLPKQLIQRWREFRSIGLFRQILELQRHAVVVMGPCRVPHALRLTLNGATQASGVHGPRGRGSSNKGERHGHRSPRDFDPAQQRADHASFADGLDDRYW